MTELCDGLGQRVALPDNLRVALCHQCLRWAAGDKVPAIHRRLVRELIGKGQMGRLAKAQPGKRPVCKGCLLILKKLEVAA